jgi:epoxyqueuosine reductase
MSAPNAEAGGITSLIKAQAYGLGFDLVGVTVLGPMETADAYDSWVARGYAGEMEYLRRGAEKRRDSRLPYAGTISAIVVGLNYGGRSAAGPVARYARGDDYHDLIASRLNLLHEWLNEEVGYEVSGKGYVDTGPLLERDLARRAGLGWFGKNTNLVNPRIGSFFFIGALLVDCELQPDAPFEADRCGTCTRCLDACPTKAFVEPRILDATKCISYLTIEQKGAIPMHLRDAVGENLYGCDICQDVCPWNQRFAQDLREPSLETREGLAGRNARDLAREILQIDDEAFRLTFQRSPMKRAKRRGLARNAAVVLGNVGDARDRDLLQNCLSHDEPLVREHAAWALARVSTTARPEVPHRGVVPP